MSLEIVSCLRLACFKCLQREPDEIEATTGNRKKPFANDPDHFESFVTLLRQHKCLEGMKRIIHEAEEPQEEPVRALACKVFSGMARSPSCKQVMSELAFFRTGEIQGELLQVVGFIVISSVAPSGSRNKGPLSKFR